MPTRVVIDPTVRIVYSSFYIEGLYRIFGKENVSFSPKYFKELRRRTESHSFDHYIAFVVIQPDNGISKFVIDFRDKPSIKESAYQWCDKYAKINFNRQLTDQRFHGKMMSIPPGFGIKIWNFWETAFYCVSNLLKCRFSPLVKMRSYLADYKAQYKRPMLESYINNSPEGSTGTDAKPYVFMIATLWSHKNCIETTNLLRKTFIEVCKSSNCDFEGGFFALPSNPHFEEYKALIFTNRYSTGTYIEKTKLSAMVFNTPSVHNCHGWKLGEYLAMGKAIISTPISNELPEELKHGENIHIIQTTEELEKAVSLLLTDKDYREKLSRGASAYYSKYASPEKIIQNLIQN